MFICNIYTCAGFAHYLAIFDLFPIKLDNKFRRPLPSSRTPLNLDLLIFGQFYIFGIKMGVAVGTQIWGKLLTQKQSC